MKKRIVWILLVILVASIVTYGEYQYLLSQVSEEPLVEIYVASRHLTKGEPLEKTDVSSKFIRLRDIEEGYLQALDQSIGQFTAREIAKGAIIQKTHFQSADTIKMARDDKHILITFAFDGETANAWNIRTGQVVELLFCSKEDESNQLFESAMVWAIYDADVEKAIEGQKSEKRFVTFEINKLDGYDLISKRNKGRVEIIIL